MFIPSSPTPAQIAILANSPALNALKRPQLIALAKELGLKASGKNVDLIKKLQSHGQLLRSRTFDPIRDNNSIEEDSWVGQGDTFDGEDIEMVDASSEGAERQRSTNAEFGTETSIPQSGSSSSLASTIRSLGGSLARKLTSSTNKPESKTLGSCSSLLSLFDSSNQFHSVSAPTRPSTPSIYPSLSPTSLNGSRNPTPTKMEETSFKYEDTYTSFALGSIETSSPLPSSHDNIEDCEGIRLVSRPTEYGSLPLPPPVRHRSQQERFDSPSLVKERDVLVPKGAKHVLIPQGTIHITTLSHPPEKKGMHSFDLPSTSSAGTSLSGKFVFGSPRSKNERFHFRSSPRVSPSSSILNSSTVEKADLKMGPMEVVDDSSFGGMSRSKSATELVLEEMNRRALQTLSKSSSTTTTTNLRHSRSDSTNRNQKRGTGQGLFDRSHKKGFDRMQGIDQHYAAKRPAPPGNGLTQSGSKGKGLNRSGEEVVEDGSRKRIKLVSSTDTNTNNRSGLNETSAKTVQRSPSKPLGGLGVDKREEIRRKLMLAKERRKSVAKIQGAAFRKKRVSIGQTSKLNNRARNLVTLNNRKMPALPNANRPLPVPVVPTIIARTAKAVNNLGSSTSGLTNPERSTKAGTTTNTFSATTTVSSTVRSIKKTDASLARKPTAQVLKGDLMPSISSAKLQSSTSSTATSFARSITSQTKIPQSRFSKFTFSASTLSSASKSKTTLGISARANAGCVPISSPKIGQKTSSEGTLGAGNRGSGTEPGSKSRFASVAERENQAQ